MSIKNIDDAEYQDFYRHLDAHWAVRLFQVFKRRHILKIFKYVRPRDGILDVGCGSGKFLRHLQALGFSRLTGLDIDDTAFQAAGGQGISFIKQSIIANNFMGGGGYEAVFVQSALHHLPAAALPTAAANLASAVGKGGHLIVYEPNVCSVCGLLFYRLFLRLFPRLFREADREYDEHRRFCREFPDFVVELGKRGCVVMERHEWSFYKLLVCRKTGP